MQANKRLIKDIHTMISDEMSSLGIYYSYDDAYIKKGIALVFGPEDTPNDYPFTSPTVLITSSDGKTRFHPNLYVNGKVCLSILGTYTGPSWVSTLNIGSVFKSIMSLLDKNPIVNEPGWESYTLDHPFAKDYSEWIEFHLLDMIVTEYKQYKMGTNPTWKLFDEIIEKVWLEKWVKIQRKIRERAQIIGSKVYKKLPYQMGGEVNWLGLQSRADSLG